MFTSWSKKLTVALLLLLSFNLSFAVSSPITMLQGMANNMIAGLKKNKGRLKSNPNIVRQLVKRNLVPYADVNVMAASAVGPDWRKASGAQRGQFKNLFTNVVISTYSTALSSYDGDVVRFYPMRGGYQSKRTVTVRSLIVRRNGQKIPVTYNLVRRGNTWRIYDFSIENVSMVRSYRSQFSSVLNQGGLKMLNSRLRSRGA
ncbi:MAG: ABC transporter substrate-binding protein [Coxiellaceae bacterium]|nr:ABC transporter substrate-binding protein [Coxiellaceae bacterium]